MYTSPTHLLKLYRNFKAIDLRDPYGIIRYYERYEEGLSGLALQEYLECAITYTNALLETDDFARHIVMCDYLIELVMVENVHHWGGEDIFCRLLFDKSTALYHNGDPNAAIGVLNALLKIDPGHVRGADFLMHCLQQEKTPIRQKSRALALLLFLISALSAGTMGLAVQPFRPDWQDSATKITMSLFGSGLLLYLYGELRHYLQCRAVVQQLVHP